MGVMWRAGALFAAAFFGFLAWMQATQELGIFAHDARIATVVLGVLACLYLVLAFARVSSSYRALARAAVVVGAAAGVLILPGRLLQILRVQEAFGSERQRSAHNALRLLISAQEDHRLRHGRYTRMLDSLRVAVMRLAPADARFSVTEATEAGWAGESEVDGIRCTVRIIQGAFDHVGHARNFLDDDVSCAPGTVPTGRAFLGSRDVPAASPLSSSSAWSQERGDASRTGVAMSPATGGGWHTRVGGSMRAGAAIADSFVVAGAHGTGWLGALDLRSGTVVWETRAPNWIHQNPVIASGLIAVGLGDKDRLMAGDPVGLGIGGVAAYDLRTGVLRWVERSTGAVMTAPVIWKTSVIYADGAGFLEARELSSGMLQWRREMPGYAVMASPALRNDTVFIALAHRHLCAFAARDGATIWCTEAPRKFRIGGDPTPSVIGGTVYWTVAHERTGVENLFTADAFGYVRDKLSGRTRHRSSQWLIAVDAATGRERWRTELGGGFDPRGNMAGTPVAFGSTVIVTAPLARRTFAVDTASGRIVWSVTPDAFSRGAVTVLDSLAVTSDAEGHVHVLAARDGREHCRAQLPDASDRSGPIVSDGVAVFTGLKGSVTSVPLSSLLRCARD